MQKICVRSLLFILFASTIARGANYEIWAGDDDLLDTHLAYYNVDEYDYVKLGHASGVATFYGDYQYYLIVVTNQLHLDGVQGSDGYFYGEAGGAHLVTGNVTDWNNAVGPTNNQYAVLGGEGSENFTAYFRFTNPGTWTSITVYALSERPLYTILKVDPVADQVWGHDWPAGKTVTVTRAGTPDETLGTAKVNEWGDWWLDSPLDIRAHDLIRAESDSVYREHVVTKLRITEINYTNNIIRGTAGAGTRVNVHVFDEDISRDVDVDEHGEWLVNFNEPAGEEYWERAFSLEPGMMGGVAQFDEEWDETLIQWRLPNPVLRVNRAGNWVWSENWPAWATVEIAIGDPGNPSVTAVVQANGDGNWWFDPDEGDYFIRAGDVITANDGMYYREMTVADLRVTGADPDNNTLSGKGVPNAFVLVRAGEATVEALADENGAWTADLGTEGVDLDEDTQGYVYFYDANDHFTQTFWRYNSLDVEEIALIWVKWVDLSHSYMLEVEGEGILGVRFQAPSGPWYDLQPDAWELEWWFYEKRGDNIEALDAEFPAGEYKVEITHYHGVSTAIATFAETPAMPNAIPQIVAPAFGQSDVATPDTELEWADVSDPNFNTILVHYRADFRESDDEREHEILIEMEPGDPFPTSVTMTNLQPDRIYRSEVIFINAATGETTGDVETEFLLLRAKITESDFSTNTDPNRFDPIARVDLSRFVIEANGDDPVYVFSFETYFTDSVASLFHEIVLRSQDGDEYRLHHVDMSPIHDNEILFEVEADDPDDLPGDGWYLLVLRPNTDTAVCTPFWFGAADRVNPLPMPTQQPVITHPQPDSLLASPVDLGWEALTDTGVNALAVLVNDDDPKLLDDLDQTEYGPVPSSVIGETDTSVLFARRLTDQVNDDGISFSLANVRATIHGITMGHRLDYTANPGGWVRLPDGEPTHRVTLVIRDGEDAAPILAVPEDGAALRYWSETGGNTDNPYIATGVNASRELGALFATDDRGTPVCWYAGHGIEPEGAEDWDDVDQRYDPDKRMHHWQEHLAGTIPGNPYSVFGVHRIVPAEGATFYFNSLADRTYTLQSTTDITDTQSWQNVPDYGPRAGKDGPDSFSVAPADVPHGVFFRIAVSLNSGGD